MKLGVTKLLAKSAKERKKEREVAIYWKIASSKAFVN
jgi:hypothetical protein